MHTQSSHSLWSSSSQRHLQELGFERKLISVPVPVDDCESSWADMTDGAETDQGDGMKEQKC